MTTNTPTPTPTAAQTYAAHARDIERLLDVLTAHLKHHAKRHHDRPGDWGFVGDLAHVRERLVELVAGMARESVAQVEEFLARK